MLSILVSLAIPVHLDAVERAKAVEATEALSEVVRLEQLYHTEKGSYKIQATLPGALVSGGASACTGWRGWNSVEGGRIEGEETLSSGQYIHR